MTMLRQETPSDLASWTACQRCGNACQQPT